VAYRGTVPGRFFVVRRKTHRPVPRLKSFALRRRCLGRRASRAGTPMREHPVFLITE
jgi:hypothetical protein